MKVKDILKLLDEKFPTSSACDFDNVGLLVGNPEKEVTKALVALDCTKKALNHAIELGCELIITHHPVIFSPLKAVVAGDITYELLRADISVISMHTNLDMGEGGVNDRLCNALELTETHTVVAEDGFMLRAGKVSPTTADNLAEHISKALGFNVRYADGGKQVEKVLVCSGSGGDFIADAIKNGYDALITAEVKHHQFLLAVDNGITLFDGGHFATENIIVNPLCDLLNGEFPEIEFISYHNTDIKCV